MRFQAGLLKLDWRHRSELKALSERHGEQELRWEARMQEALEDAGGTKKEDAGGRGARNGGAGSRVDGTSTRERLSANRKRESS